MLVSYLVYIKKLNTTTHQPQCDEMIEGLNRTLKGMLRKQAAKFGTEWDTYLPGALWAYRNTSHTSTGEIPSYLLFVMTAALLLKLPCYQVLHISLLTSVTIERS